MTRDADSKTKASRQDWCSLLGDHNGAWAIGRSLGLDPRGRKFDSSRSDCDSSSIVR